MDQAKYTKNSFLSTLLIGIVALCLNFAGMVMCFLDEIELWRWIYYYEPYYEPHPEAGAMPLVGFVLLLVAVILLSVGFRKGKKQLLIASLPLLYVSQALNGAAIVFVNSEIAAIGTYLCDVAMGLAFIIALLVIIYLAIVKKPQSAPQGYPQAPYGYQGAPYGYQGAPYGYQAPQPAPSEMSFEKKAASLKALKDLLDLGAISQSEFEEEKAKIMGSAQKGGNVPEDPRKAKLAELKEMYDEGLITEEEYNAERRKVLGI